MNTVNESFRFQPWDFQVPALQALDAGKNAVLVWHRRAGKDLVLLNYCITQAYKKPGVYYYLFPTYAQGKKIFWDGMDNEGTPYRDYIPEAIRMRDEENETEMQVPIRTFDGRRSIIQVVGTDNINRIVGTNPLGAVYSEFALQSPRAKALLDPIFAANRGWQAFAYTPRGKNHGWDLYDYACHHSDRWYASKLTIDETHKPDGHRIVETEYLNELRALGQDEDLIQQEYYCSFEGAVEGSYYGRYLALARNDKPSRVGFFPWITQKPVRTAWDLGRNDTTVIWFYQKLGQEIRLIDYYENSGVGADHYGKVVMEKPYRYDLHLLPHDADAETIAAQKTVRGTLSSIGLRPIRVVPKLLIETGISAVRRLFPRFRFNEGPCDEGLKALAFYHKKYDELKQTFLPHPEHDWSSNAADALRYLAVGENDRPDEAPVQVQAEGRWDAFSDTAMQAEYDYNPFGPVPGEQTVDSWR